MEEGRENSNELSNSAHANGMNEWMFVLLPVWWDVVEKSVKPDVRETRSGALKFDESSFHVFFRGLAKLLGATSVHAQNLL